MAAAAERASKKTPQVGGWDWLQVEFDQVEGLCENELEDFRFSARNEVEWLNEHMADIFTGSHMWVEITR